MLCSCRVFYHAQYGQLVGFSVELAFILNVLFLVNVKVNQNHKRAKYKKAIHSYPDPRRLVVFLIASRSIE